MTNTPQNLPEPLDVVVWMPPGGQLLGIIGLIEAFDAANRVLAHQGQPPLYRVQLVGAQSQTQSAMGPTLDTRLTASIRAAHTVVVGGSMDLLEHVPDSVVDDARPLVAMAQRVVSVCMGAFVVGALGKLDGKRCTTHWLGIEALRARHATAQVLDDALFTHDGPLFTSAGATAGIDLALHLIRLDGGAELALTVARLLVVFAQRPGGQSQFGSSVQVRVGVDDRLRGLMAEVRRVPGKDHSVVRLAKAAGMSPRHFARVFRQQTGQTPAAFVSKVRVEVAQRALLQTDAGLSQIAHDCGFGSVETLRRTFGRVAGTTPSGYRQRFGVGTTEIVA